MLIVVPAILFLTSAELLRKDGTHRHASVNPEVAEQGVGRMIAPARIIDKVDREATRGFGGDLKSNVIVLI